MFETERVDPLMVLEYMQAMEVENQLNYSFNRPFIKMWILFDGEDVRNRFAAFTHIATTILKKMQDSSGGLMLGTYTSTRAATLLLLCIMSPAGKLRILCSWISRCN